MIHFYFTVKCCFTLLFVCFTSPLLYIVIEGMLFLSAHYDFLAYIKWISFNLPSTSFNRILVFLFRMTIMVLMSGSYQRIRTWFVSQDVFWNILSTSFKISWDTFVRREVATYMSTCFNGYILHSVTRFRDPRTRWIFRSKFWFLLLLF